MEMPLYNMPPLEHVLERVCLHFPGVTPEMVLSKNRNPNVCLARHAAAYVLYSFELPGRVVANMLCRSNHSTALNSVYRVRELMEKDPSFCAIIERL